jgi:hypothetical protein
MFTYGYSRRLSSHPSHLTAPNGLNFSRSVGNPNSRLEKVRQYLSVNGPSTKREILYKVFGKKITDKNIPWNNRNDEVSSGWGSYLFSYGVHHGYFQKVRKGNAVYWSLR